MLDKNVQSNEQRGLNHSLMNCTVILGEKNALFLTLNPFSNGQQTKSFKQVKTNMMKGHLMVNGPRRNFLGFQKRLDNLKHFIEKALFLVALTLFALGCIPAYFEYDFCAVTLWIIGSAILNAFVFFLSYKKIQG